jgi:hypothetical protein
MCEKLPAYWRGLLGRYERDKGLYEHIQGQRETARSRERNSANQPDRNSKSENQQEELQK